MEKLTWAPSTKSPLLIQTVLLILFCSSQSTSAQTCATTVFVCFSMTHRSSGERRGEIRAGPWWCWILYRVWGSWTGGIHSTLPHPTHRSPTPSDDATAEHHSKNPAVISSSPPNTNMIVDDSAEPWIMLNDKVLDILIVIVRCLKRSLLRWDVNLILVS